MASDTSTRWMPEGDLALLGLPRVGPETDYGVRWGENHSIRVSFAPYLDHDGGYVYAHDARTQRCLLLAADTSASRTDAAYRELLGCIDAPDAYLAFAALGQHVDPVEHARSLLHHCIDRELDAYRDYQQRAVDDPDRFGAAYAVVVQRSARVAAEGVLTTAARSAAPGNAPVIVRYRMLGERGWTGRITGTSLDCAVTDTYHAHDTARRHGLTLQATSVTSGNTTLSAARIPQLGAAAGIPPATAGIPQPQL